MEDEMQKLGRRDVLRAGGVAALAAGAAALPLVASTRVGWRLASTDRHSWKKPAVVLT